MDGDRIHEIMARENQELRSAEVSSEDLPVPQGDPRNLEYISVQNEFPSVYGIGEEGLPSKASEQRKARAKQLQAYLLFFDQIFANYTQQLKNMGELFAVTERPEFTYFKGDFEFAGSVEILREGYRKACKVFWKTKP